MAEAAARGFWPVLTAAPHRVMFLGGAVQLTAPMLWWAAELLGRYSGLWQAPVPVIGALWGHVWLMVFTLFPYFIFGFLMTTYPRWMNQAELPRGRYTLAFLLLGAGVVAGWIGLFHSRELLAAGMVLHLAGWGVGLAALIAVWRQARGQASRYYETHLNMALACGWAGEFIYLLWLLGGDGALAYLGLRTALWLFLLPVLVIVAHRMIPYFSSVVLKGYRVVQPPWTLPIMWAACSGHLLLESLGRFDLLILSDLPLLVAALHLTRHWRLRESLAIRLLGVLHIAFLWLSIGLACYLLQSAWMLAGGGFLFGRGPLHALTIGFVTGMVVAMATRVSQGHSGRPLVMDNFAFACFLGVQGAALLRLFGDLSSDGRLLFPAFNTLAALLWLLALLPWSLRYGYIYLTPRADGRAG